MPRGKQGWQFKWLNTAHATPRKTLWMPRLARLNLLAQINMAIVTSKEKRPHWEGVGAAKGYPAEQKFLVMNARRHQSDTRVVILRL